MKNANQEKKTDRRLIRAEQSREAITRAMFDLISEGDPTPTIAAISKRAGVSVSLVYYHYSDTEALYIDLITRQLEKVGALLNIDLELDWPFEKRLATFLKRRTALLEAMTPVRKSLLIIAYKSELVAKAVNFGRQAKRDQVSTVFSPELARFRGNEAKIRENALQNTGSWNYWNALREHSQLSFKEATNAMGTMIRSMLS